MIGHLDCSTGVSGDKFLGALLDVGTQMGVFDAEDLARLVAGLAPEARVITGPVRSHGLAAVGLRVEAASQPAHRHYSDIRTLLHGAELPEAVRASALRAFEELAVAEAAAHGCDIESVHFHEVGAIDSIVDIVGTCAAFHAVGIDSLIVSAVATGWGTVDTSHGLLPVPAPATAALLVGASVVPGPAFPDGSAPGELTTPTGAALVRALGSGFGPCPALTLRAVGYGAGTRDIGSPNVCRIALGEPAAAVAMDREAVTVLETNVDHLSGEAAGFALEQLLAEGALDAWATPVVMKKSRPGLVLAALVPTADADRFAARLIALTGSLGVRRRGVERSVVERESFELETPRGRVRYKAGIGRPRPEADDVARIARETGRGFADVHEELSGFADTDANAGLA